MKSPVTATKTYKALALLLALCLAAGVFSFGASAASAPPVPAAFKASSASYNSVKLTWSAVSNASGYVLYRYSAAAKAYARLAVMKTTAYTNTGLVTGAKYYYKVRAYQTVSGKNIYGSPSAAVSAVPVPGVPAAFKASSASYDSVKLTWSATAGASGYVLYRYSAAAKAYARLAVLKTPGYTDTGLTTGASSSYKVRAFRTVSGKNIYGNPGTAVSAVPVPGVPADFKAAAGNYNNIKLSWSAVAGASGYVVYRYDAAAKAYARLAVIKTPGYTNTGLVTGASYSYKVRAYRTVSGKNIYGNPGTAVSAVPVPGVPADFKAAAGNYNNIKLSWSAVAGASGYVLYRLNAVSGAYERLAAVKTLTYADEGLAGAGPQSYKIIVYRTVSGKNIYGRVSAAVQAKPGIFGPVGGSAADIVDFYNRSANATKDFKGKVTVERSSHMSPKLVFMPEALRFIIMVSAPEEYKQIQALEDELKAIADMPPEKTVIAFENGAGGYTTLTEFLPPSGSETMSTLAPEGAASAACVSYGGGWKVVITLVKESGPASTFVPPHHNSCLNTPDFSGMGDIEGAQSTVAYQGAKLTAYINAAGRLTRLDTSDPVNVLLTMSAAGEYGDDMGMGFETVTDDNFVFTY